VFARQALTAIPELLVGGELAAVGVDGPMRPDFTLTTGRRGCEQRLQRAPFHQLCSPGSTSARVGQQLHAEATRLGIALAQRHPGVRLVEAFPTAFLRTLLHEDAVGPISRARKSQVYWEHCWAAGVFGRLLDELYGGDAAAIATAIQLLKNRDERAAAVCAMTASAAAHAEPVSVGDAVDGWIWLAPRRFLADWASRAL
jgi:hypothetical protein